MIASLTGILRFKSPGHITVEVNGVGYRVFIPLSTFYELADEGSPIALNVYTAVREDAIHLYGFRTPEEKQIFELLLSVNGSARSWPSGSSRASPPPTSSGRSSWKTGRR